MKKVLAIGGVGLLVLSAALLAGSLIQHIMPPVYQSVARVLVKEEGADFGSLYPKPSFQQKIERFQSKFLLCQVITNLDLNQKWGAKFMQGTFPIETTYEMLKTQLRIGLASKSSTIIEVRVRSDDPVEAAAIANEIAKVRLDQLAAMERYMSEKGIEALNSMAQEMAVEIQGLETKLNQMSKEQELPVDGSQPALLDKGDPGVAMLKLRRELQAYQVNRERLMSRLKEEKTKSLIPQRAPVQLINSAEPELRPVEPSPVAKILMPVAGLLAGGLGVVLILLGFKLKAPVRKSPPPLPV